MSTAKSISLVLIASALVASPFVFSANRSIQDRTVKSKSYKPGALYSSDKIVGNMRFVPPTGPQGFVQGSPAAEPGHLREAQFTHILTKKMAVMETEVTRQMWADLKALQPSLLPDPTDIQRGSGMDHPVQNISWYDAILFANLLSLQNGLSGCYYVDESFATLVSAEGSGPVFCEFSADGYRLPTEGEWEYFTRAGTTGPFSIREPNYNSETSYSGDASDLPKLAKVAVFNPMEMTRTWPVRSLKPNPWKLYGVHGNVWEWVWDRYDNYPKETVTDYAGPAVSSLGIEDRSTRGGGWTSPGAKWVRSAARGHGIAGYIDKGFRLVRTL
ncbi:MAG: SUMF1/EgtB/PvdO family nonheme iron enzyme [Candidatus Aminicenantaceae bacterium]